MTDNALVPLKKGALTNLVLKGGTAIGLAVLVIWIFGWWLTLGAALGYGAWRLLGTPTRD